MKNVSENQKKNLLICFGPVAAVFVITMRQRIYTFMTNLPEDSLYV